MGPRLRSLSKGTFTHLDVFWTTFFCKSITCTTSHPKFRLRCRWLLRQSQQISPPCLSLDQDPRLSLSENLPPHPPPLQRGCAKKNIAQEYTILLCVHVTVHCICLAKGCNRSLPAWNGLASPGDADCVFTRLKGVIFTLVHAVPYISHFHLLLCSRWGGIILSIWILISSETFHAYCLAHYYMHMWMQPADKKPKQRK